MDHDRPFQDFEEQEKNEREKKKNTKNDVFFARKIAEQQITEGVYRICEIIVRNFKSRKSPFALREFFRQFFPLSVAADRSVDRPFFFFFFTCEVSIERLKREGKKKKKKRGPEGKRLRSGRKFECQWLVEPSRRGNLARYPGFTDFSSAFSLPLSLSFVLFSFLFRLFHVSFLSLSFSLSLSFPFSSSSLLIELPVGGDRRGPGVDWPDVFLFGPSGEGRRYDGLLGFYWCTSPRIGISVSFWKVSEKLSRMICLLSTFKHFSHDTNISKRCWTEERCWILRLGRSMLIEMFNFTKVTRLT